MARQPPPSALDRDALDALALAYAARYATTRAKLLRYLVRKLRERGWAGGGSGSDAATMIADRMVDLRFVDDEAYATAKTESMTRRGYGEHRIDGALKVAGVSREIIERTVVFDEEGKMEAAMAFARRRRFGPFSRAPADREQREKQVRAFLRAGHDFTIARQIVALDANFVQDT